MIKDFSATKLIWAGGALCGIFALASLFACGSALQPKAIQLGSQISSSNAQQFLTNNAAQIGMLGYWKFEETTAHSVSGGYDFLDSTGTGNNLSVTAGSVTYAQTGISGSAILTSSLISASTAKVISTQTSGITMSAWVNWNGAASTSASPIFYNGIPGTNGFGLIIHNGTSSAGGSKIGVESGSTYNTITSLTAYPLVASTWTHLAMTYDGTTWTLYINGVAYGTGTGAAPITPTGTTYLGKFPGDVDEVTYWNQSLPSSQIMNIYLIQSGKFGT